jgi:hypothetical protein
MRAQPCPTHEEDDASLTLRLDRDFRPRGKDVGLVGPGEVGKAQVGEEDGDGAGWIGCRLLLAGEVGLHVGLHVSARPHPMAMATAVRG